MRKYDCKYRRKYGYSLKEVQRLLGWSYGSVHAKMNDDQARPIMLDLVRVERINREED